MKKITALTLFALMIVASVFFTACGDSLADSGYVGTWKCTTGEMGGTEVDIEKVIGEFTITLSEDGKATVKIDKEQSEGEWELKDGGFVINNEDGSLEFKEDASILYLTQNDIKMEFKKEQ